MTTRACSAVLIAACCVALSSSVGSQERHLPRQLTDDPAQDGFPSWSPDGRSIVFSRYGGDAEPAKTGLHVVSTDGGAPRRLTTVIGEHPDWSPDGRYIAFDGDFGNLVQVVSADGGTPIRLVPESVPVSKGGQPKWSPDGSRVVFKEGSSLWVLEVSTGRLEKLFTEPDKLALPACWSRDGQEIYVTLRDVTGGNAAIWAVSATGQGRRRVTPEEKSVYRYADLSPDGSLLAVVWCEGRNCDLWVMSPVGGKRVQITSDPAYDDGPSWSPDGTKIAFVSTRSGHFDIWMVDVDVDWVRRELAKPGP